jgi:DNA-binding XRE family transcriptional regulator
MAMICQPDNFPATVKKVRRRLALSQEQLAHARIIKLKKSKYDLH